MLCTIVFGLNIFQLARRSASAYAHMLGMTIPSATAIVIHTAMKNHIFHTRCSLYFASPRSTSVPSPTANTR